MKYTVMLKDGTIGTITFKEEHANDFIGKVISVNLTDENGNPIKVQGELVEVLEESEY